MVALLSRFKQSLIANKVKLTNIFLSTLLFIVIILNSGYTITYLQVDTFAKTLISLISFLTVGFIFAVTVDYSSLVNRFKSKKPTISFVAICIFVFSALLTMFCTAETSHLISYASYLIQIFSAFIIAKLFNFKKFVKVFQTGLLIVCLITILFYIASVVFKISLSFLPNFTSTTGNVYDNFFFLSFQSLHSNRMQGPFWEPGLFSTFLLIGLAFEIILHKKIRWFYFTIYTICIILTQSTFGYLAYIFILLLLVNKKVERFAIVCILYFLIFGSIIVFFVFAKDIIKMLATVMPSVFSKMILPNGKVTLLDADRFLSPSINFQIWFKSPVYGTGLQGADTLFAQMFPRHAQTSTLTFYLSQFGILGIAFTFFFFFGLWKNKTFQAEDKIVLTMLFILLLNKEPHNGIIFDWILMFLFLKEGCENNITALAFDSPSENSVIKSFTKKDDASILKRNITASLAIKGLALILGFFAYPIYKSYFNNDSVLGIWLSVLSIMAMIISLDLGLGNGLKNKIVIALSENDTEKQRQLISSTYFSTTMISLLILVVLTPIIFLSNLNEFFHVSVALINPVILKISTFLVCLSICIEFTLKNVNSLLQAKQKQALSSLFALISTLFLMIFAAIYRSSNLNNLLLVISIVYVFTINIPLLLGTLYIFTKEFKGLAPSKKYITKKAIKSVTTLGIGFFIIQLLLLFLNSTNETFISNIFGSSYVVEYTNYYKPFSIVSQLFSIITLPIWALVAKEKAEGNVNEIIANIKKLFIFLSIFTLMLAVLSLIFQPFMDLWLGEGAVKTNYLVVIIFDIYIIEWMVAALFSVVANGLSIIKSQIIFFAVSALLKVIGCIILYFVKDKISWYYVMIVNVIAFVPLVIGEAFIVINKIKTLKNKEAPLNE